jgi:hypothetical protein
VFSRVLGKIPWATTCISHWKMMEVKCNKKWRWNEYNSIFYKRCFGETWPTPFWEQSQMSKL